MDGRFVYMNENISSSKTLSKVETFEKLNLLCKYHKNKSENAAKLSVFLEAVLCNVAQVSIMECVRLVNEGRLLLVIEFDGCGS